MPLLLLLPFAAGRRELTHAELDELHQSAILAHLRSVLVATGTLPSRDEQMARLERFLRDILATRTDPDQRQILHRYANWHLMHRLRRRNNGQPATHQQYAVVHQHARVATVLLDWLTAQHLTLATSCQADLCAGHPSPWLFPGGQPGRPISATHLGQRLKDLGIHIGVAVAWQRASAGRRLGQLRRRRQPPPRTTRSDTPSRVH